jgi:hypothetical protein
VIADGLNALTKNDDAAQRVVRAITDSRGEFDTNA